MSIDKNYIPVSFKKQNILDHIRETISKYPDREAFISGDGKIRMTYKVIDRRANRLANALIKKGVKQGDRVAIFQTNCCEWAEQFLAILKIGAIVVPLNFRLKGPEALFTITESGAGTIIFDERYLPMFETIRTYLIGIRSYICTRGSSPEWAEEYEELLVSSSPEEVPHVDLNLDSVAAISFTSGTTGLPKGSITTHRNALANLYCPMSNELMNEKYFHPELGYVITLLNVPIYHIGGVLSLYLGMSQGSALIISEEFTPKTFIERVEREQATVTFLVPTMFAMVLESPEFKKERLNSLRLVSYGAMAMSPELLNTILSEYPDHIEYRETFGCTECNSISTCKMPEDHDLTGDDVTMKRKIERLKSVGRSVKVGIELKTVDDQNHEAPPGVDGEIVCRGEKVTPGYWRNQERTAESFDADGWFHTGDMARKDKDGYIYFADRKKDMINRGGENIYPLEVERTILLHPNIMEVAVFGVPDPRWGHVVHAAVVQLAGETITFEEIINLCKKELASYKCPSHIHFIDKLPRSFEGGKVLRRVLREQYS
jgi:acyl-CoA synthetase (AMP-forming)/AMP-acid ligase II